MSVEALLTVMLAEFFTFEKRSPRNAQIGGKDALRAQFGEAMRVSTLGKCNVAGVCLHALV